MGSHLNPPGDSLDLAQFDLRWGKRYLEAEIADERAPFEAMRTALRARVAAHLGEGEGGAVSGPWGWKHPHSYLLLPWLDSVIPDLRFIHFVRDGRRMAFSSNQIQPRHYGEAVFGAESEHWAPHVLAMEFWSWANGRTADYGERQMGARYLRARFEDVCADPQRLCRELIDFARGDTHASDAQVSQAAQLVSRPPAPDLDPELLAEVQSLDASSLTRFGYL